MHLVGRQAKSSPTDAFTYEKPLSVPTHHSVEIVSLPLKMDPARVGFSPGKELNMRVLLKFRYPVPVSVPKFPSFSPRTDFLSGRELRTRDQLARADRGFS